MSITNFVKKLFNYSEQEDKLTYKYDEALDKIAFYTDAIKFSKIENGDANAWLMHQYSTLNMLAEQGYAESIPNGFVMSANAIVNLDLYTIETLGLPEKWDGKLKANINGVTSKSNFNVEIDAFYHNRFTQAFKISGPFIEFGSIKYLLSPCELAIFEAFNLHKTSKREEYDNLLLLSEFQIAKKQGADIQLGHFDHDGGLSIHRPGSISIELEEDKAGNFILTPNMQQTASHEQMQKVIGQLQADSAVTLKVGKEIILFNEEKLKAVKEVLNSRVIPHTQKRQFLKNPTAFIDASLVNLDIGFSHRVKGLTTFKHAYFGETDESGIDWFGTSQSSGEVKPLSKLMDKIETIDDFLPARKKVEDASSTGATIVQIDSNEYDISDTEEMHRIIEATDARIKKGMNIPQKIEGDIERQADKNDTNDEVVVVDIDLNDEELSESSPLIEHKIEAISRQGNLDWNNYLRKPFKHQLEGVKWILGLYDRSVVDHKITGGLLADDMGLGKTFMSLSAVEHLYRELSSVDKTCKPTLIVAPLSLLENWKDEVDKTFKQSPFIDTVILQSNADLPKFRHPKASIETKQSAPEAEIKYSLKIGRKEGVNRLDQPKRLVITTYQTLRDYQFSLCSIDWGMVIFDEAQNIKNPNALQTRAAKGLKSDFKLVATGTPVENSLTDFWCLTDTACPGYLGFYQNFRDKYILPICQAAGDEIEEVRARIGRELRLEIGALMLRRLKEDNLEGLPLKNIFVGTDSTEWKFNPSISSVMKGTQLACYDAALEAAEEMEGNAVLGVLQRLRNTSLHPRLVDGGTLKVTSTIKEFKSIVSESQKLESLIKVLDEIRQRKEKCIIFAVNKKLQSFLAVSLGSYYNLGPLSVVNGDAKAVSKKVSTPTRKTMISDFEKREGFNIIIMSPVAAGVGLTVVGANNVVHYERHWNPAKEAQATDRVYRIGQTKDVNIYVPILHHPTLESFDLNLHKLLSKKLSLKDAVVTPEDVIPSAGDIGVNYKEENLFSGPLTEDTLASLSWQQFEALCVELLSKEYGAKKTYLTNEGSDLGVDGVVVNNSDLYLVQVKHTRGKSYSGGHKAITEVIGAAPYYEKSLQHNDSKLIFVTNANRITPKARKVAKQSDVTILMEADLSKLLTKHQITYKEVLARLDKKRIKV